MGRPPLGLTEIYARANEELAELVFIVDGSGRLHLGIEPLDVYLVWKRSRYWAERSSGEHIWAGGDLRDLVKLLYGQI